MNLIAISYLSDDLKVTAQVLAKQFNLPLADIFSNEYSYLLVFTPTHLELRAVKKTYKPFYIDFLSGKNAARSIQIQNEVLVKAVGVRSNFKPVILDTTAGLGRDGFILATIGCEVTMLERSNILYLLLNDALTRLKEVKSLSLKLIQTDSREYLKKLPSCDYPDVVYLDPMFPIRTKSSLVKKEMQILHDLVGVDEDSIELFHLALKRVKKRVVVKRPRLANPIADNKPSFSFIGRSTRFDVYLVMG